MNNTHSIKNKKEGRVFMEHFNDFIKSKRIEKEITLRSFCRECQLDPSNWSKVENGISSPPKSKEILDRIKKALNLSREEYLTMIDLAIVDSIPVDLINDEILNKLPIIFRTIRGEKSTRKELEWIYEIIKRSSNP